MFYDIICEHDLGGTYMREKLTFQCTVCGEHNYIGTRNKRKHPEKMEIKKYCPRCNKQTSHKEKK